MYHYHLNGDSSVPVYRQLVDQISAQIRSGALKNGTQLPTVREMAEKTRLSLGTVKRAYDCLQEMGDIEMTRRRGTFVKYVRKVEDSRKHQAMHAIDSMIKKLMELHFSPAEIQIFLNLKMREWGLRWSGIRITVVTEYTEMAAALAKQLEEIGNVQVNVCPLSQLREYPYSIDEQSDVILATRQDGQSLAYHLPESEKLIHVAFQADAAQIRALALCAGKCIGILCESEAFYALAKQYLPAQAQLVRVTEDNWPMDMEALVLAQGYAEQLNDDMKNRLAEFEKAHAVYPLAYLLDEGSMLYLGERISKIRDERQQWPGMLRL